MELSQSVNKGEDQFNTLEDKQTPLKVTTLTDREPTQINKVGSDM